MTPGAYLKCRRCAAGKSVADVAESIGTDPTVPAHLRAEWLKLIEADAAPIGWPTIVALRTCIPIDLLVLERLTMIQLGADVSTPRLCRLCGAVETGPLGMDVPKWGWAARDLCIGCAHATTEPAPA